LFDFKKKKETCSIGVNMTSYFNWLFFELGLAMTS